MENSLKICLESLWEPCYYNNLLYYLCLTLGYLMCLAFEVGSSRLRWAVQDV